MTDKVEFHVLLLDFKRALKKALKSGSPTDVIALARAEVALIEGHQKLVEGAEDENEIERLHTLS